MEMKTTADRQRGVSLIGFIMITVGVLFVGILGIKIVPAYLHSSQIAQIFKTIAKDPAMQGASVKEIKDSYTKRANISYVTDITADDIEVIKSDGQLSLSTSYSVKIPVIGNVTLLLDFNPSSS
jgi:hypothetical protein